MWISVLMSAYRTHLWVQEAIQSTLDAILPEGAELRLLCAIDGPDPATLDAARQVVDERLRIVQLKENVGTYIAKNTLIPLMDKRTTHVAIMDSDDVTVKTRWLHTVPLLKRAGLVGGLAQNFPGRRHYAGTRVPFNPTIIMHKWVLDKLGGWDAVRYSGDVDFYYRAKKANVPMAVTKYTVLMRRKHDHNLTTILPHKHPDRVVYEQAAKKRTDYIINPQKGVICE